MKNLLTHANSFLFKNLPVVVLVAILALCGGLILAGKPAADGSITLNGENAQYSDATEKALCELKETREQALAGLSGANVPQDATSGCAPTDLPQMGSLTYYKVGMSTPTEFKNSVIGRGFNEGYGYQCVAGFKEFMYSLSGKYVSAAGGGAKGYATQQAQIEPLGFKWHAGTAGMQDGDWAIWTNGQYGHVAMKFGNQWLGQNQYAADPNAGNPFNLANISTSGIAGYYRPNIYVKSTPAPNPTPNPQPQPQPPVSTNSATVRRGDTLGGLALRNGWWSSANGLYGDSGYAQRLAERNGIVWRGLIYPNQVVNRAE